MKNLITLFRGLDETNSSLKKIQLLIEYFENSPPEDTIWGIYFLSGNRFKRLITSRTIRRWAREKIGYPSWLFNESLIAVGDSGEGISLLLDALYRSEDEIGGKENDFFNLAELIFRIRGLNSEDEKVQKETIFRWWDSLDQTGIFVLNKVLTGAFRVGVSKQTVANAISQKFDLPKTVVLQRMMGNWEPNEEFYQRLISQQTTQEDLSSPYPYFLASPLETKPEELGDIDEWFIEWKWDGIRAQLVKRSNQAYLWSRGEDLINKSFPEVLEASWGLPDEIVLDGEILCYYEGKPMAFSVLQRRIGRENVTDEIKRTAPVIFVIYDILEEKGTDVRELPLVQRKELLSSLKDRINKSSKLRISDPVKVNSWEEAYKIHERSREKLTEGFILKRNSSPYRAGRIRGDWWKWKVDPLSIDAVLIYAQSGSGRRANLFTAYTFAIKNDEGDLIPVGRAYSGLTNDEIRVLDKWIRKNTDERFGPVRSVKPYHVFELGFDGIMSNPRSKSGVSLRFPRMLRWRKDKKVKDINSVTDVRQLLKYEGITEIKMNTSLDDFF